MSTHRQEWERTVEEQLKEGAKRFGDLSKKIDENTAVTKALKEGVEENTAATLDIYNKLDAHVESYEKFRMSTQPAIDAIITMQAGVRVIGKIGSGLGWIATKARKAIIWIAPIFGFFATLWAFFHDKPAELWQTLVDWWAR